MKLEAIRAADIKPIKNISIEGMENVVIIAGANGSGKTRLKEAIIQTFQNPSAPRLGLTIKATRGREEADRWGSDLVTIDTSTPNQSFTDYMNSRTRGGSYTGAVIQIDSNRSVSSVSFRQMLFTTPDPDDIDTDYRYFLDPFTSRWNETVNRLFEKAANRDFKIARYSKENPDGQIADALRKHPDPFVPFHELFAKLLPGKTLETIDPKQPKEFQYRIESDPGAILSFSTLSSGEQEVVKITFDLLLKQMTHCVFLIDEPELHLHPTLTFRLIETLKEIGAGTNQFIFFTHSADLISTYYSTGNVYFIDSIQTGGNQAHRLSDLDDSHQAIVRAMSENLGLFAVGKKLIFVEGQQSSRDRLTYHAIAQVCFQEAQVIPVGSADNVLSLNRFGTELQNAVFGIDFYMIRDRDGLTDDNIADLEKNRRMRCLRGRHLENYFLDGEVIAKVAKRFCLQDTALHNPANIESILKDIAERATGDALMLNLKEYIRVNRSMEIPTVRDIQRKTVDEVQDEFLGKVNTSVNEWVGRLTNDVLAEVFKEERKRLEDSLKNEEWKTLFPGKLIFERFCGKDGLNCDSIRVRQAYVEIALKEKPGVFKDVVEILTSFRDSA